MNNREEVEKQFKKEDTINCNTHNEDMLTQKILTREFILWFLGQFMFTSVFHLLTPTLPIYLSRLASSEVEIGILEKRLKRS